jgi:hypothetical protein
MTSLASDMCVLFQAGPNKPEPLTHGNCLKYLVVCEMANGSFRGVIMPGYAIVLEESKEAVLIP